MDRDVQGSTELPEDLLVLREVLGQSFGGQQQGCEFTVTFPVAPEDPTRVTHAELLNPATPRQQERLGEPNWGWLDSSPQGAHVRSLAFRAAVPDSEGLSLSEVADRIGRALDQWLWVVLDWAELWGGQAWVADQPPTTSSHGRVWDPETDERSTWNPVGYAVLYGWNANLTSARLSLAAGLASEGISPSDEWQLFLRARRVFDARRAIIDAGTAAEVCVSRQIHDRLSHLPDEARHRVLVSCNGLVGQIRLLEDLDGVAAKGSTWRRIAQRIAHPRNVAVHSGVTPSAGELQAALDETRAVLTQYSPLPEP